MNINIKMLHSNCAFFLWDKIALSYRTNGT